MNVHGSHATRGRSARSARGPSVLLICALALAVAVPSVTVAEGASAAQTQPARVEVVDAAGRKVSLAKVPQRIVVVGQGPFMVMHLLYMFPECRDRLVGYEEKFQSADTFLPLVDPGFSRKVALATNPGAEQIATLHPDLVIMKATAPAQLGQSLAVLGIPVVYFGLEDPERFLREVEMAGTISGNRRRAREIVRFYQDRLDRIRTRAEGVAEGRTAARCWSWNTGEERQGGGAGPRQVLDSDHPGRSGPAADPVWLGHSRERGLDGRQFRAGRGVGPGQDLHDPLVHPRPAHRCSPRLSRIRSGARSGP